METPEEVLLSILDDLGEVDFKTFKWYLQKEEIMKLKGFRAVPVSRLQNAERTDTVDVMTKTYSTNILNVTRVVLVKMNRWDLVKKLSRNTSEPAETSTETGAAAGPSSGTEDMRPVRDLDLRDHHPGASRKRMRTVGPEDLHCRLDTVRVDHDGQFKAHLKDRDGQFKAHLKTYFCKLTLDTNTAHRFLRLSDDNRTVTRVDEDQSYPDHPDRFDIQWSQVLSSTGLTGRGYWEVDWTGRVFVAVTYGGIRRKGNGGDCGLGFNAQSWSLICFGDSYSVLHNNRQTLLPQFSPSFGRVSVYVDVPAGSLSFYRVSDELIHLHTFNTTFTEPLYAGFMCGSSGSSVSLCDV